MGMKQRNVVDYTRAQVSRMVETELRLDPTDPDGDVVHDLRVAVRRLRSMLRVFPSVAPDAPPSLDEQLRAWGACLGRLRDVEVVEGLIGEVSPALARRTQPRLADERRTAVAAVEEAAREPRHAALLSAVTALDPAPPARPARAASKAEAKAERRLREAGTDPDLLHRARKAAKRARYACEAVGASARAKRWKRVQDRLGDHHDRFVVAAWLAEEPRSATARRKLERAADALLHE